MPAILQHPRIYFEQAPFFVLLHPSKASRFSNNFITYEQFNLDKKNHKQANIFKKNISHVTM